MSILLRSLGTEQYTTSCGLSVQREYNTLTPNGNPVDGRWVLRDAQGVFVDHDKYINDLAERHNLDFEMRFSTTFSITD